jgi:hypothetical protein
MVDLDRVPARTAEDVVSVISARAPEGNCRTDKQEHRKLKKSHGLR